MKTKSTDGFSNLNEKDKYLYNLFVYFCKNKTRNNLI